MSCSEDGKRGERKRRKTGVAALHRMSSSLSTDKQDAESKQLMDECLALEAMEQWLTIGWISPGRWQRIGADDL